MSKWHKFIKMDTEIRIVNCDANKRHLYRKILFNKPLWKQVFIASAAWNVCFLLGMAMGTNTVAIPQMIQESIEISDAMRSWFGSIFGFASLFWILVLTPIINYLGVKKAYIFVCCSPFIGSLVTYFSYSSLQFLFGQTIQCITQCALSNVTIMVLTEYINPKNRAFFLTIKSTSLFLGIWVANSIGTFFNWRYIAIVSMLLSLYGVTVCFWPESPYWLASKGKVEECADAFRWCRGTHEDTEQELENIIKSFSNKSQNKNPQRSINGFEKLKNYWCIAILREFYFPMFLCCILIFLYMSSGKFALTMYSIEILKTMTDTKWAYSAMLILDGINILGMYCGCYLAKKFNRKTLLFFWAGIGTLFLYLLSIYAFLVQYNILKDNFIISLTFLMLFFLAICMGPMILVPTIESELIPNNNRLFFCNVLSSIGEVAFGGFLKIEPDLLKLGHNVAFLIHAGLSTISLIVLSVYLPETKDKTSLEINEGFKKSEKRNLSDAIDTEVKEKLVL